jgi:hypothetical protein
MTTQLHEDTSSIKGTKVHVRQISMNLPENRNTVAWTSNIEQLSINRPKCRDKSKTLTIKADIPQDEIDSSFDDSGVDTPKNKDAFPPGFAGSNFNSDGSKQISKSKEIKTNKKGLLCGILACFKV